MNVNTKVGMLAFNNPAENGVTKVSTKELKKLFSTMNGSVSADYEFPHVSETCAACVCKIADISDRQAIGVAGVCEEGCPIEKATDLAFAKAMICYLGEELFVLDDAVQPEKKTRKSAAKQAPVQETPAPEVKPAEPAPQEEKLAEPVLEESEVNPEDNAPLFGDADDIPVYQGEQEILPPPVDEPEVPAETTAPAAPEAPVAPVDDDFVVTIGSYKFKQMKLSQIASDEKGTKFLKTLLGIAKPDPSIAEETNRIKEWLVNHGMAARNEEGVVVWQQ